MRLGGRGKCRTDNFAFLLPRIMLIGHQCKKKLEKKGLDRGESLAEKDVKEVTTTNYAVPCTMLRQLLCDAVESVRIKAI